MTRADTVARYCHQLATRGWVANHDGNVSIRTPGGFLISPGGVAKRLVQASACVACELDGSPQRKGKPPSEAALHVGAYAARPRIQAVIHAHPPFASAYALARKSLGPVAMPEVVVSLGAEIPMMPLILPKDPRARPEAQKVLSGADVALLAGNGALAVGDDIEQAFLRMEVLEHYCQILTITTQLGGPSPLPASDVTALLGLRERAGLLLTPPSSPVPPVQANSLRQVISDELKKLLEEKGVG